MSSYVVTGAQGFIGYHLVKRLEADGHVVFSMDKDARNPEGILEAMGKLPTNVDGVFHLASVIGSKEIRNDPYKMIWENMELIDKIVEDYKGTGVKIVYTSSAEVVTGASRWINHMQAGERLPIGWEKPFDPRWAYSVSKFLGELLLHHSSAKYTILRLSNVYGPRMIQDYVVKSFIRRALAHEDPFEVHSANDTRCFTYVDDVVDALVKAMESEAATGQTLNIGSEHQVLITEVAEMLAAFEGYTPKFDRTPSETQEKRQPDCSKAKRILGWEATTPFATGLKKTFDWYKDGNDNR